MQDNTKITHLIESSLHKIRELAETDTIIGKEIRTPDGTTIIPISKMSVGFVSGGLDYNGKKRSKDGAKEYADAAPHFGGGGGTGISVSPVAFLVVSPDGKVDVLPITPAPAPGGDSIDKILALVGRIEESSPKWLAKIKALFSKKKANNESEESEEAASETTEEATDTTTV